MRLIFEFANNIYKGLPLLLYKTQIAPNLQHTYLGDYPFMPHTP